MTTTARMGTRSATMLVETLIILVKILAIMLGFGMTVGAILTVVERKQSAFIHNRIGPNRANLGGHIRGEKLLKSIRLGGLIHLAADGIKMIMKEDIVPSGANRVLHAFAPALALFPALVLYAVIPWGDYWCSGGDIIVVNFQDVCLSESHNYFSIADLDVGFLYVFAIASLGVYSVAIAGWSSNSKFSLLGGLRASAQMISYEVPMGLSVLGVVMIFGTLNLNEIVRAQGELAFGVLPMWGIFLQPLGFLIFLVAMIAETKRAPFDLPEGESEIVAGYLTEFTSMKFGTMMVSEFVAIGFVGAMVSVLFLGGWQIPYLYGDGFHVPHAAFFPAFAVLSLLLAAYLIAVGHARENKFTVGIGLIVAAGGLAFAIMTFTQVGGVQTLPYWLVVLARIGAMVFKVLFMCWMQLMIRWTVPRFRYDQVMRLGWKVLLPAALLNVLVTALILIPLFS
jgi:NADH-quinone oxidoreductase subunit H